MANNTSELNDSMLASATTTAGLSRLEKMLAMTGGVGADSYAQNSSVQSAGASETVLPFYEKVLETITLRASSNGPPVVRVADLGCSSGSNAIAQMSQIVQKLTGSYMHDNPSQPRPEFQAFFCDLPSTDFNTLFQLLTKDKKHDFFMGGTPGSFYGRLYPRSSINVFYSTFCLHFLSKVPNTVLDKNSPAFHRGDWALNKDSSSGTRREIQSQAASDLKTFLHARAIELSPGGVLMFAALVQSVDDIENRQDFLYVLSKRFVQLWRELTAEGLISQETAESFFIPIYDRSTEEILEGIQHFSSQFSIHHVETTTVKSFENLRRLSSVELTRFYKAVIGGMIKDAVGDEVSEVFWDRTTQAIEAEFMPNIDKYKWKDRKISLIALTRKEDGGDLC